jgi:hypothetical protein
MPHFESWSQIYDGTTLEIMAADNRIRTEFPSCPAIYMWLRRFSPSGQELRSGLVFERWLEKSAETPVGKIRDRIKHFGTMELEVGGASITTCKAELLSEFAAELANRRRLAGWLKELDYSVVMYVGEASVLYKRIEDHLNSRSDFGTRVAELELSWSDLGLRYLPLPEQMSASCRRSLEYYFAVLLLAPLTSRAG